MKCNALLTDAVIFHNALDIAEIVRQLLEEGWEIDPEDLAHISPCLTEHINRFGAYSTHELGIRPSRTIQSSTSTSPRCASRTSLRPASAGPPEPPSAAQSHVPAARSARPASVSPVACAWRGIKR